MPDFESLKIKFTTDSASAASKIDELTLAVGKLKGATAPAGASFKAASIGVKALGASAVVAGASFKGLGATLGSVRIGTIALIAAARQLAKGLGSCVKESMDFVETMNLFNVSMGDNAIAAGEFAEKVQQVMGIDMAQWMRNQGVFQTLIEGFGVASEKADIMSQQVTQLGYDLSSLFNMPFAESMQKLQSGIAGELEPLRRIGFDLSQAKLQQIAYDHGIQQSISTMTQAEKVQLRYYAIMTQVTTAHGDMARTITQPANMLRVLKENIVIASRSIGNLMIPIMQKLMGVAILVARGIAKVAAAIGALFGIDSNGWRNFMDDLNYNGGGIEDIADDLDDVGGAAGGATKKMKEFKKQFLGFDKINNITLPTEPSSGGGGGGAGDIGGGGFDLEIPTYDFLQGLDDAFGELHPRLQKLFDDLAKDIEQGGHNVGRILGLAIRDALVSIDWEGIKKVGNNIASRIADGLNDFIETPGLFAMIAQTLAQSLNTVFSAANTFAKAFHWDSLGKAIADSINRFFSTFDFGQAGNTLFNWASGILTTAINAVKNVDWGQVGAKIADFLAGINWEKLISEAIDLAGLVIKGIADFTIQFVGNLAYKILEWLYNTIKGRNEAALKINLNGKEDKSFTKVYKEYDETSNKNVTVTANGKEKKSFVKTSKDFGGFSSKDVTVTTKGETTTKYKKTREDYDGFKDKDAKAKLKGETTQSAKDTEAFREKFKDKTVTASLKGTATDSASKLWYNWYVPFKDKDIWASLKGDRTSSIYNLWYDWYAPFKDKDVTISVYGDFSELKNAVKDFQSHVGGSGGNYTFAEGGILKGGRWLPVTAAANGGAFGMGQMFIAREAGPELVGTIGGHTAVMNNDQIVSSVAAGVASANAPQTTLLQQLLNAVQSGDQQIVLQLDSTKFGEASIRSINRVQRQQGRTLLQV